MRISVHLLPPPLPLPSPPRTPSAALPHPVGVVRRRRRRRRRRFCRRAGGQERAHLQQHDAEGIRACGRAQGPPACVSGVGWLGAPDCTRQVVGWAARSGWALGYTGQCGLVCTGRSGLGWVARVSGCGMGWVARVSGCGLGWVARVSQCGLGWVARVSRCGLGWVARVSQCGLGWLLCPHQRLAPQSPADESWPVSLRLGSRQLCADEMRPVCPRLAWLLPARCQGAARTLGFARRCGGRCTAAEALRQEKTPSMSISIHPYP